MMERQASRPARLAIFLFCFLPAIAVAGADRFASHIATMEQLASSYEREVAIEKLAAEFSEFSGSQQSAEAIMGGLHDGTPFTLPVAPSQTKVSITPSTPPMSLGNAYIAMGLTKMHLVQLGISSPSALQIKMALEGGRITQSTAKGVREIHLPGVLKQRATGKRWETIAKQIGVDAGGLVYRMQAANYVFIRFAAASPKNKPNPFFEDGLGAAADTQQADLASEPSVQQIPRARRSGAGIVTAIGGSPASVYAAAGGNSESIVTGGGDLILSNSSGSARSTGGL